MGSDRVRAYRKTKSSSTLTTGFKPKQSIFLQPRYQDRVEAESDSFTEEKQQNSSDQANTTPPFLGHSFGRVSVLPIQTKLTIGQPGDKHEQEADRVAEQVMRMPEPKIQRICSECEDKLQPQPIEEEEDKEETLQTKKLSVASTIQRIETNSSSQTQKKPTIDLDPGEGQPVSPVTRAFMEPRFGIDFGHVRLHTDERSQQQASQINARAFTYGHHIWLGRGESEQDKRLMAHELTHVVQQSGDLQGKLKEETLQPKPLTRQITPWLQRQEVEESRPSRNVIPKEIEPEAAAELGEIALNEIGYKKLINMAKQQGLIREKHADQKCDLRP